MSMLYLLLPVFSQAQDQADYEEVSVYFNMQRIGNIEMSSLIRNDTAYLPVGEIFDYLKIANKISANRDSISGFFMSQTATYLIDNSKKRIIYKDKTYSLKTDDLIKTPSNLYLKASYFGEIFGLQSVFSYRNLSVTMSTDLELPVLRDLRLAEMRSNINQLKGEVKVDTTIKRTYPAFHFGTADWSVINTQDKQLGSDTRVNLRVGGILAGGETDVSINYHSTEPLIERNQYYRWRLANNENTVVRQITAGKIFTPTISTIFAPVVGIQITNTPTTFRRSFGTYTISNTTQPNWTVELYVNNVLVSYVKADASGFYSFEVPLIYGNSMVKLRFYGPAGEETFTEQNISIPFNFLPAKEFEYSASAGFVEDGNGSRFSRLSANYGMTSFLTIGGGTEYLSSVTSGHTIPFVNSSARILPNLLLSAEHAYGVRTKALLTYKFKFGLQVELNNSWYEVGQTAINNTFKEERKAILSLPFRGKSFSAYTRLTINQNILPVTEYTTAEWLVSAVAWNINANVNTFALFTDQNPAYLLSNFSVSKRIFKSYLFTQHLLYAYQNSQITGFKEELERRVLSNGYLRLSYERNILSNISNFEIGLRYDFRFAQTGASFRTGNNTENLIQFASGSLIADGPANYTSFTNRSSVGKGGIMVVPFLDLNFNGKKDRGEPKAAGLKLKSSRAGIYTLNAKDTTLQILQLEPYENYILELDAGGFENVAWQLTKKNYSIAVDPNIIKMIEIPVNVMGEAAGNVNIKNADGQKGLGRLIVMIYRQNKMVARILTESDGYFSFLGLPPGDYTASLDTAQLSKLNLKSTPVTVPFNIKISTEGSVTDGLEFVVTDDKLPEAQKDEPQIDVSAATRLAGNKLPVKTIQVPDPKIPVTPKRTLKKDIYVPVTEDNPSGKADEQTLAIIEADLNHAMYGITVQIAHFRIINALSSKEFLINKIGYDAFIRSTGKRSYFNVYVTGLKDKAEAKALIKAIKYRGFPDAFIVPVK